MKVTVFGSTGRIGEQVVRQALDGGHKVTAVVRDPSRLAVSHSALEVVAVPGLTDPEMLRPALEGSDARSRESGRVVARMARSPRALRAAF
jgi:uncharacterized protein YbjT (DUF2867 family)